MTCGTWIYVGVALLVSLYQAYRGFMFQWLPESEGWIKNLTTTQKVVLLCVADTLLYLVSTAAGFLALFLAYALSTRIEKLSEVGTGTSVLLVFLALFGILGVAGQLPHLLQEGKLLPKAG